MRSHSSPSVEGLSTLSDARLAEQLRGHDPVTVLTGLQALEARLVDADPERLGGLACLLPTDAAHIPRDLHTQLLALHRKLASERIAPATLRWRHADLPLHLQAQWLSTEVALAPERLLSESVDERLMAALQLLQPAQITAPSRLLKALIAGDDPVLRDEALRLLPALLAQGALPLGDARAALVEITAHAAPHQRALALEMWSAPWFVVGGAWRPGPMVDGHIQGGPAGHAAINAARLLEQRALLRRWVTDPRGPLKAAALRALGQIGEREDVEQVLTAADEQTADAALSGLLSLRHRGFYVQRQHLSALLALFAAAEMNVSDFLALTAHLAADRERAVARYPLDALAWRRLAPLADPNTLNLLIEKTTVWSVRRAALAVCLDENSLLSRLDDEPETCLDQLRRCAGESTWHALQQRLGLEDGTAPKSPALRANTARALALLWQLTPHNARAQLLQSLDPNDLPAAIRETLGVGLSEEMLAFLSAARGVSAVENLHRLCWVGAVESLPAVRAILRNYIIDLVEGSTSSTIPMVPSSRMRTIEGRYRISDRAISGLHTLGKRLFAQGHGPLVHLPTADRAGEWFVADLLLEIATSFESPSALKIALEPLITMNVPELAAEVRPWLRHDGIHVRTIAARVLAAWSDLASGHDLVRLAGEAEDIETRRAAIEAVSVMGLSAGAPALIAALEHRNMNIKRAAAVGLAQLTPTQATPRLLFWLGYHDNQGFRKELFQALAAIHGESIARRLCLEAWEAATTDRGRRLLAPLLPPGWRRFARPQTPKPVPEIRSWDPNVARQAIEDDWLAPETAAIAEAHPIAWVDWAETLAGLAQQRALAIALPLRAARPIFRARLRWLLDLHRAAGPGHDFEAPLLDFCADLNLSAREALGAAQRLRAGPARRGDRWLRRLDAWGADLQPAEIFMALEQLGQTADPILHRRHLLRHWLPALRTEEHDALLRRPDATTFDGLMATYPISARWERLHQAEERREVWRKRNTRASQKQPTAPPSLETFLTATTPLSLPTSRLERLALDLADQPEHAEQTVSPERVLALMDCMATAGQLRLVPWLLRTVPVNDGLRRLRRLPTEAILPLIVAQGDKQWHPALVGPVWNLPPTRSVSVRPSWIDARKRAESRLAVWTTRRTLRRRGGPRVRPETSPEALLKALNAPEVGQVRAALRALSNYRTPEVVEAVAGLLEDARPSVRTAAHRCLKHCASRARYLEETIKMLSDPRDEVQRSAIRTVSFARYAPAIRPLIRMLDHRRHTIQSAAEEGLMVYGTAALRELRRAERKARPDQRSLYTELIDHILEASP